jgi:superfamily II DNA/RNA helicase
VEKAEVKARSERDHPQTIAILLGTDAASEGLNLQQFSALINYDLPWNLMWVEQRIGRIDRIGQEAPAVKIPTCIWKAPSKRTPMTPSSGESASSRKSSGCFSPSWPRCRAFSGGWRAARSS